MTRLRLGTGLAVALLSIACGGSDSAASADPPAGSSASTQWALSTTSQLSGTEALLQAVAPVDDTIVWVSGHRATYARSLDGGSTWEARTVPGDSTLQFRDVAAFDATAAYLMSAGEGERSRIYRTDDAGESWELQYTADHPAAFLDCMDFWSPERGLVYGDAIDGVPFLLRTDDGGDTWTRVPAESLPAALEGEGGFAASGTCLRTAPGGSAWVATGNGERPRVLRTTDYGESWSVVDVPVVGGPASGLAAMAVGPAGFAIALGGVIGSDSVRTNNVTVTRDGGASWLPGGALHMEGPVYGVGLAVADGGIPLVVAVGPRGVDMSTDAGAHWVGVDSTTYWAVDFASASAGWAVGPGGRIVRLEWTTR